MKLYRKKLNSLEALKREQIRLRYERRSTRFSDLVPFSEGGSRKYKRSARHGVFGTVMELAAAKSDIQMITALAKPLMKRIAKKRAIKKELREELGLPHKPSFLKRLLKEIAIGYLTGKAVLMAAQGIRLWLKRRRAARLKARLAAA